MLRTGLLVPILCLAACTAPPGPDLAPGGDPFAGLAPPPLPAPASHPWKGPFGPRELGAPPVEIVPAPPVETIPSDASWPRTGAENPYGDDTAYGDDFGAGRLRRRR